MACVPFFDRLGAGVRVDAGLSDHALQGTNAAHRGDLVFHASLVAIADVIGIALLLLLAIRLWLGGRWWSRALLVLLLLPALAATWLARQNHFEWMFNPLPNPAYAKSADAGFITDEDRVLSVTINGESVAYPVRLMAYHHLVEDTVGGTPIVATY